MQKGNHWVLQRTFVLFFFNGHPSTINIGNQSDVAFIEDFTRENFMYLARYGWPAPLDWGCRPTGLACSDPDSWGIWKGSNSGHMVHWVFVVTEW